uniref:Uncharacterized protein n=1 Tax=Glycine max TaxID=3847 RepID=A0A0R0JUP5_SOYBN
MLKRKDVPQWIRRSPQTRSPQCGCSHGSAGDFDTRRKKKNDRVQAQGERRRTIGFKRAANLGKEKIVELICDHFPELLLRRNVKSDTVLDAAVRSKNSTIDQVHSLQLSHREDKEITKEKNEYGDTPLHEAVYSDGDVGVIKEILLVDNDVVYYLNKSRQSPQYLAVLRGNKEILNRLLEILVPADKPLPQQFIGNSPLHAAVQKQDPDLIQHIIEKDPS